MEIIGIDREVCTGCGLCVKECPADLFSVNGTAPARVSGPAQAVRHVVRNDNNGWCTGCGHCISVCPVDAIRFGDESMKCTKNAPSSWEFEGVSDPPSLCSYDTVLKFLSSKRSVRHYRNEAVPKDMIDAVLEAMRYAPTGHNLQGNRYLVIRDPVKLRRIVDETAAGFKRFRSVVRARKLLKPFISSAMYEIMNSPGLCSGLEDLMSRCGRGEDPILHSAPVIVISYYPSLGPLSLIDPTIAFTYGMLAAHALGLGTCWIGFAIQALWKNRRMKRYLGVPKETIVTGVMTLGYPAVQYARVPPRNTVAVKWI